VGHGATEGMQVRCSHQEMEEEDKNKSKWENKREVESTATKTPSMVRVE
jgi:hypothetical protein